MKKNIFQILLLFTLSASMGCEEVIFFPSKGNIEGVVTDNNGTPLAGVQVVAVFEPPAIQVGLPLIPTTLIAATAPGGYYRLSDLWDEVSLSIDHLGFRPTSTTVDLGKNDRPEVDFTLVGSPTIQAVTFSKTTLSIAASDSDTVIVTVEVHDSFNTITQGYESNLLLQNADGVTQAILAAGLESQGLEQYLFSATVTSGLLPAGTYAVIAEVRDPDKNIHQVRVEQSIRLE